MLFVKIYICYGKNLIYVVYFRSPLYMYFPRNQKIGNFQMFSTTGWQLWMQI